MSQTIMFLKRLANEGGALLSAHDCSSIEIACARAQGRFLPDADDADGGYILFSDEWREKAAVSVTFNDLARLVKRCGPMGDA